MTTHDNSENFTPLPHVVRVTLDEDSRVIGTSTVGPAIGLDTKNKYMALCRRAFANQNRLNSHLDDAWVGTDWDFLLAAAVEIRECYDHLNWSWWKPAKYGEPPSRDQLHQIHLELADTFHFLLSQSMRIMAKELDPAATTYPSTAEPSTQLAELVQAREMVEMYAQAVNQWQSSSRDPAKELKKALAAYFRDGLSSQNHHSARIYRFFVVCAAAELSFEKLMLYYFAKGVLNGFRWSHGYREANPAKRYKKKWLLGPYRNAGKPESVEDNVVLARWLQDHADAVSIDALSDLEAVLGDMYAESEGNYAWVAAD